MQLLLVLYMSFNRKLIGLQSMLLLLLPALFHTGRGSSIEATLCSHLFISLAACLLLTDSKQNS